MPIEVRSRIDSRLAWPESEAEKRARLEVTWGQGAEATAGMEAAFALGGISPDAIEAVGQ